MFDNMVFNVNGGGKEKLAATLKLAFFDHHSFPCKAWSFSKEAGLVLSWHYDKNDPKGTYPFPTALNAESCVDFVWEWLQSEDAKTVMQTGSDVDADHDGHNKLGWRVYLEEWGYVYGETSENGVKQYAPGGNTAICAIKPVYLWFGK